MMVMPVSQARVTQIATNFARLFVHLVAQSTVTMMILTRIVIIVVWFIPLNSSIIACSPDHIVRTKNTPNILFDTRDHRAVSPLMAMRQNY
jgi:hypothetical protein